MMKRLLFIAVVALSSHTALAADLVLAGKTGAVERWNMQQTLDHVNPTTSKKFSQRVFIHHEHARDKSAPVILEICGEWNCGSGGSPASHAAAKALGGTIVIAEHRFYGQSQPFPNLATENLRYLSTDSAISDLVNIIRSLRSELHLSGPIVSIGCSYAGNLSAYLRATHPELVSGAVACSAPVEARSDWHQMDTHIAEILGPHCSATVKNYLRQVEAIAFSGDEKRVSELRSQLELKETRTPGVIMETVTDMIRTLVQWDQQEGFCKDMEVSDLDYFIAKINYLLQVTKADSYSFDTLHKYSDSTPNPNSIMRQWTYQTCTEYGYWQIAASQGGVFPASITPEFYLDQCRKYFGISKLADSNAFNRRYFERVLQAENILFTNSNVDSWSDLSIRPDNNRNPRLRTHLSEKGAHCQAMSEFEDGVPQSDGARAILKALTDWAR